MALLEAPFIDGELASGIEHGGKVHKTFRLRAMRVADSIASERDTQGEGEYYRSIDMLARQLVSLGEIPKEEITVDLLGSLFDEDLKYLLVAKIQLQKKMPRLPKKKAEKGDS